MYQNKRTKGKRNKFVVPNKLEREWIQGHSNLILPEHIAQVSGYPLRKSKPRHDIYFLYDARYIVGDRLKEVMANPSTNFKYQSFEHKRLYDATRDIFLRVDRNRNGNAKKKILLENGDQLWIPISHLMRVMYPEMICSQGQPDFDFIGETMEMHHRNTTKTKDGLLCNDFYNLEQVFRQKQTDEWNINQHGAIHDFRRDGVPRIVYLPIGLQSESNNDREEVEES